MTAIGEKSFATPGTAQIKRVTPQSIFFTTRPIHTVHKTSTPTMTDPQHYNESLDFNPWAGKICYYESADAADDSEIQSQITAGLPIHNRRRPQEGVA